MVSCSLFRRALCKWSTLAVLLLVLLWTYASRSEFLRNQLPLLAQTQLKFHQFLTWLIPGEPTTRFVRPIEIDDSTFWHPPLSGVQPTNRRFLADIVRIAGDSGATVIAIDFRLTSPTDQPGDDPSRAADNEYLLKTIEEVTKKGIPVLLTYFLMPKEGRWVKKANIFPESTLPSGSFLGHLNLPVDKRQIPLQMTVWENDAPKPLDSFALQIVEAYEGYASISPRTKEKQIILAAEGKGEFLFGAFVRPEAFKSISAHRLWEGDKEMKQRCQGRIVIIGGTWHEAGAGAGKLIEEYPSPVGPLPGLYFHANYVEALLQDRYTRAVPLWVELLLDIVLGLSMYIVTHLPTGAKGRIGILVVFLLPLSGGYVIFANFGRYLDSIMPLSLCFVHLGYEHFRYHFILRKQTQTHMAVPPADRLPDIR